MVDLVSLNLTLDVLLKLMFLGVLIFMLIILKNVNKTVKSANRSAESVKKTADKVSNFLTFKSAYSAIKGAAERKGGKNDE